MNPLVFMGLFFILVGLFRLSAPDFIWGQTVRSLRRRGILVAGRTPDWERNQRLVAIVLIVMGIVFIALGGFLFPVDPRLTQSPMTYSYPTDGIFRTPTPAYIAPVVNSP